MEILEENYETVEKTEHPWDSWLVFDNRPRILERGTDFTEDTGTLKRHLVTEAARRSMDVTAKALAGDRLLFQVFSPDGAYPKLPEMPDARKKYPWDEWLDGEEYHLYRGEDFETDIVTMRQYIYKKANERGLKVTVWAVSGGLTVRAYSPTNEKVADV